MAYSTIPEEELVERPKQKSTSIKRLVAMAALVSFAVGAACAAALDAGKYAEGREDLHVGEKYNTWYDTEDGVRTIDVGKCAPERSLETWTLNSGEKMHFWVSAAWPWSNSALGSVETLYFVIHGSDGDGDSYMRTAWDVILQEIDPDGCNSDKHYVIAPQFNDEARCASKKSRCGSSTYGPMATDGSIKWHRGSYWASGQESIPNGNFAPTSSYDVLDQFLDWTTKKEIAPKLKRVVVIGYSGGAQYVQRYSLTSRALADVEDLGIKTSIFIGAPESVAYLDESRPDLSRSEDCWKKAGCDHYPDCGPDTDINLDKWSDCVTKDPYAFARFEDMGKGQKSWLTQVDAEQCYSGANPQVPYWAWKYQAKIDDKIAKKHMPQYLRDNYFKKQDHYNARYRDRQTIWFVGTHDGEGVANPDRAHCADLVQGDSHLQVTVASYQYTWHFFNKKKNNHELFLLPNVRHVHLDAVAHDLIRACWVRGDCVDDAKIHKGCSWDDVQAHPHYIADKEKWLCSDYDKECAKSPSHKTCCKDGCDNAAIHSACTEPQTAQFLWEEWRCGWPGWQEQYP